jgi:hypothetical protein
MDNISFMKFISKEKVYIDLFIILFNERLEKIELVDGYVSTDH